MTALTFKAFRGAVPRNGERLQRPNFAKSARNIKITSGNLVPLRGMQASATTLAQSISTIWRYRRIVDRQPVDAWLTFESDTDVCRSLIADDADNRIYWTSDAHEPRMSTGALAIDGPGPYPTAWYMLGVPSPTVQPSVSVAGGSGTNVTRSYAYTFTTALGEESGPSPASDLDTGFPNGTWSITNMQTAPPNSGTAAAWAFQPLTGRMQATLDSTFGMQPGTLLQMTYDTAELPSPIVETVRLVAVNHGANQVEFVREAYPAGTTPVLDWSRVSPINTTGMRKRIYRTEGAAAASIFVAEVDAATTSYDDSAVVLTGEVMQTLETLPPPARLQGLISLPNGCLVGFVDNEVCFSDPYMPYSWPVRNRQSFTSRVVAIGPIGNSVIVLTDSYPIMLTGSDPRAMSPSAMESYAPCVSKRGAVNVGGGMLYPSHDGLWLASSGRVELMTRRLYRADEWAELNAPSFVAEFHDGQYFATHTPTGQAGRRMLVLDIAELDSAVTVDDFADALFRNDFDGSMYVAKGSRILKWDADDQRRYLTEWTSVEIQLGQPTNFKVAQVHADYAQVIPPDLSVLERNQALMASGPDAVGGFVLGSEVLDLEIGGSYLLPYSPTTPRVVQMVIFEGDTPVFSKVVDNPRPFRLPSGYKHETIRVGINASVPCYSATIAESTAELIQAST